MTDAAGQRKAEQYRDILDERRARSVERALGDILDEIDDLRGRQRRMSAADSAIPADWSASTYNDLYSALAHLHDANYSGLSHANRHQSGGADGMAIDAAVGTGSLRTLGAGSLQAAAGDHAHFVGTRIRHSANQDILNNTWTVPAMDTEAFDEGGFHAGSDGYVTIPSTGKYLFVCHGSFAVNATGRRLCLIYSVTAATTMAHSPSAGSSATLEGTVLAVTVQSVNANDQVRGEFWQDSGATLSLLQQSRYSPVLAAVKLG